MAYALMQWQKNINMNRRDKTILLKQSGCRWSNVIKCGICRNRFQHECDWPDASECIHRKPRLIRVTFYCILSYHKSDCCGFTSISKLWAISYIGFMAVFSVSWFASNRFRHRERCTALWNVLMLKRREKERRAQCMIKMLGESVCVWLKSLVRIKYSRWLMISFN